MPILQVYVDDETMRRLEAIHQLDLITPESSAESFISEGVLDIVKKDRRYERFLEDRRYERLLDNR